MSDAESRSITSLFFLALGLSFVAFLASEVVVRVRAMDEATVVEDVDLFLKRTRLQNLVSSEDQIIIDAITAAWSNANYRGRIYRQRYDVWAKQSAVETGRISSP